MRHNLSLTNQLISHWIPGAVKVVFFLAVIIKLFCNTLQKSFRSLHLPKIASRYLWVVEHVEKRRGWGETGEVAA